MVAPPIDTGPVRTPGAPRAHARRRGARRPAPFAVGLVLLTVLLVGPLAGAWAGAGPSATSAGFTCRVVFGSTPSALAIPNAAPNATLVPGDQLIVSYEYQVQNFSSTQRGMPVEIP
ncbi:MAG: hypothetical protein L3K08_03210, partial [Thermoplasmata archaeon]|nr:hypothetical protein [Thermoplasmata archaeon]